MGHESYYEYECGMVAALIDDTRLFYGIKTSDLVYGLCDKSILAKLCTGKIDRRLDKLTVDALMQRMGCSMRMFEYMLMPDEYKLYTQRQSIRLALEECEHLESGKLASEFCKIRKQIEQYKDITRDKCALHLQYALWLESRLLYTAERMNIKLNEISGDNEYQIDLVIRALRCSIPDFGERNLSCYCYSELEMILAVRFCMLELRKGIAYQAYRHMEELLQVWNRNYYADSNEIMFFAPLFYQLAKRAVESKEYEKASRLCKEGKEALLKSNKIYFVNELTKLGEIASLALHLSEKKVDEAWKTTKCCLYYDVLKQYLEEFCPKWDCETEYTMYREYGNLSLGKIIKQRRELWGLTREQLIMNLDLSGTKPIDELCGEELCSLSTLKRLENEKSSTQWRYVKRLLIKLKLPPSLCVYPILSHRYKAMRMWRDAVYAAENDDFEKAMNLYEKLKASRQYMDCPTTRQGMDYLRIKIQSDIESWNPENQVAEYTSVLQLTLNGAGIESFPEIHLFSNESECLWIVSNLFRKSGDTDRAIQFFRKRLISELELNASNIEDTNKIHSAVLEKYGFDTRIVVCLRDVESEEANRHNFDYADRLINECFHILVRNNILGFGSRLCYDKAWNIKEEKRLPNWKNKYIHYMRMAYVIADCIGNEPYKQWLIRVAANNEIKDDLEDLINCSRCY